MHFIIIFLQYNRSNIQDASGLLGSRGPEMLPGSRAFQHRPVPRVTCCEFSARYCFKGLCVDVLSALHL